MKRLQLLKEPGYIYDLMFVFYLIFNDKLFVSEGLNEGIKESSLTFYKDISSRFGDIPEDLFVFFHALENDRIFLTSFYFAPYKDAFTSDYSFRFLQEKLSDHNKLIRRLIRYYFRDLDGDAVKAYAASPEKIFAMIKQSDYSNEIKIKLYEFFIDPERYIRLLEDELAQKENLLSQYYKEHYRKILDLYQRTTLDSLLAEFQTLDFDAKDFADGLYVSYCLLNDRCIYCCGNDGQCFMVLGCEYQSLLGMDSHNCDIPDLSLFGAALSEENRVKILAMMVERGELTVKDLEKECCFSGSTAYHHINILSKAGLLKSRNEGKTIFYRLNKGFLNSVIKALRKMTTANDTDRT